MIDHAYDAVTWRRACAAFALVVVLGWGFTACVSPAPASPVAAGRAYAQGCTADVGTTGQLVFTEVLVVGITPQGFGLWVKYPRRSPRVVNGQVYAELLPAERFIPRGGLGHAGNGRATRCPEELWGGTSTAGAAEPQP